MPPRRIVFGNAAVVMPAASWRISSSRVSMQQLAAGASTSSRYQRSRRGAAVHVGRQLLVVEGVDQLVVDQHVLAARLVLELLAPARSACGWRRGTAASSPTRRSTSASRMKISRAAAGSTVAEVHAPVAVDHDAVERGALQRHHLAGLLLPVRLEQLRLEQVAGDAAAASAARSPRCRGRTAASSPPARRRRSSGPASSTGARPGWR